LFGRSRHPTDRFSLLAAAAEGDEPDDGDRFCGGIVARRQTLQDVPLGGATPTRLGLNRAKGPRL
jgi:hypothetical protein